jgi:hypothetical protein
MKKKKAAKKAKKTVIKKIQKRKSTRLGDV